MAKPGRFPLFDAMRGLGAVMVIFAHAVGIYAGASSPESVLRPYIPQLDVAIPVFFVISGFLLYRPFARAHLREEPMPWTGAYAWRRFLRIVPAYYVALTIAAVVVGYAGILTAKGIPTYYGFVQIYRHDTAAGGIPIAYTLCIEVTFYAFLPVWALLMRRVRGHDPAKRLRHELAGLAALAALSMAYKLAILWSGGADDRVSALEPSMLALPAYLDQLVIGMGLGVLSAAWEEREGLPHALGWLDRVPGVAWVAAAFLWWFASIPVGLGYRSPDGFTHGEFIARHVLQALIALALMLPAALGREDRGLLRRALNNRVLVYLGLTSYGIYLYHLLVISELVDWGFEDIVPDEPVVRYAMWFFATLAGAVICGSLSWFVVERPALSLKRLVGRRRGEPAAEASAEAAQISAAP